MLLHFCTTINLQKHINQEAQRRNYFLSSCRFGQVLPKNHFTNNIIYIK